MLWRDAARLILAFGSVSSDRILCRICGCALGGLSGPPLMVERIVDPIRGSAGASVFELPRMVLLMCTSERLSLGAEACVVLFEGSAGRVVSGTGLFFKADFRGLVDCDGEATDTGRSCEVERCMG